MRATLLNKTDWPEMNIWYPEEKGRGTSYKMRFWQPKEKCAVFELPGGKCEQRVWNSHIKNTHHCDNGYHDICGGWSKMIYNSYC
uniref:Lipocalin n=1 Tax=Rhipicephalus appendiculatus TaxID=34631 RepID=A0A131Z4K3_RHIAP